MKKLLLLLPILILGISAAVWQNYQNESKLSDTALANLEALAGDGNTEGGEDEKRPPEWWDFFNNYEVEEIIDKIHISGNINAYISGKTGDVIASGEFVVYSQCVYHHCFDGGDRDECSSSHVHCYR